MNITFLLMLLMGITSCFPIARQGFAEGTLVHCIDRMVPIEQLRTGDLVLCYDQEGQLVERSIVDVRKQRVDRYLDIMIEHEHIFCGIDQLFYIIDKSDWTYAVDMTLRLSMLSSTYGMVNIDSMLIVRDPIVLYDISVEELHNFCVSTYGVCVHNYEHGHYWSSGSEHASRDQKSSVFSKVSSDNGRINQSNLPPVNPHNKRLGDPVSMCEDVSYQEYERAQALLGDDRVSLLDPLQANKVPIYRIPGPKEQKENVKKTIVATIGSAIGTVASKTYENGKILVGSGAGGVILLGGQIAVATEVVIAATTGIGVVALGYIGYQQLEQRGYFQKRTAVTTSGSVETGEKQIASKSLVQTTSPGVNNSARQTASEASKIPVLTSSTLSQEQLLVNGIKDGALVIASKPKSLKTAMPKPEARQEVKAKSKKEVSSLPQSKLQKVQEVSSVVHAVGQIKDVAYDGPWAVISAFAGDQKARQAIKKAIMPYSIPFLEKYVDKLCGIDSTQAVPAKKIENGISPVLKKKSQSTYGKLEVQDGVLTRSKKSVIAAKRKAESNNTANNRGPSQKKPSDDDKVSTVANAGAAEALRRELKKNRQLKYTNDAKYHHKNSSLNSESGWSKSPAPKDGQAALDNSVVIKTKTGDLSRRIGVSEGEFVVLDEQRPGEFHGHVRKWKDVDENMRKALEKAGKIKTNGKNKWSFL